MTREDKELLLKDLCARLTYNPLVEYNGESYNVLGIAHGRLVLCKPFMSYTLNEHPLVEEVKPYLFPLSSMTEEQREELYKIGWYLDGDKIYSCFRNYDDVNYKTHTDCFELINWCYKNKLDINGLIPMGLANDATGLNIY